MDKNSRLLQINERLNQIQSIRAGSSNSNPVSKVDRLSEIDERLSQINKLKLSGKGNKYSDFSPFLEARGVSKTAGALIDLGKQILPVESVMDFGDYIAEKTMSPEQLESFKQEKQSDRKSLQESDREKYTKYIDELSGNQGEPEGTIGQFRQKVGEFLPSVSVAGLKIAPAIAAVSQGLRELGIQEDYADLISAIGVPNFKAITQLAPKALKKLGSYLGTIGNEEFRRAGNVEKAAKFLQEKVGETNIPEVVSKIEKSETPFKGGISSGEQAYRPLTADIADNVGLSQYHRAKAENIPEIGQRRMTNEQVLQREVDKLASGKVSPQVSQEFVAAERKGYQEGLESENRVANLNKEYAESKFEKIANVEEAGRETQDYLANRVTSIEKEAQAKAAPLYEAAKAKTLEGEPRGAFDYINEQMRENSRASEVHRDMKKSKIAIENATIDSASEQKKLISDIKKKYKDDKNMMTIALKEIGDVPRGTYNAGRLDKAKREISRILESVPYQEKDRRRILTELIKKLDKDMESIPEIFEARKVYRDVMAPSNVITENPILGKLIHKADGYTRPFTVTHSEIPDRVIKANKSVEGAKALMSEAAGAGTKEHKQVIETLKSYINSDILSNFVETSGKVNPKKFESWSKSNPGSFVLYPELKTKLKDLKNAQIHVDRTITQNEELLSNFYKNSMGKFLGSKFEGVNPDKIASRILGSTNSESVMQEAVELLSKDKTGNAIEGLKRSVIDNLNNKFKSDKFTFATFNSYLDQNRKALSKIFNNEQMQVLEKSKDLLKNQAVMERAGKGTNSDTAAKLMENFAEKSGGKASEALTGFKIPSWIVSIGDWSKSITDAGKLKYIHKALLDPKMAKFLLQKDVKTKKNFFDSLDNKEDFAKWLRGSESFFDSISKSAEDIAKNFYITSQAVGTALINDE
jgi:hypothetical protein